MSRGLKSIRYERQVDGPYRAAYFFFVLKNFELAYFLPHYVYVLEFVWLEQNNERELNLYL
jgi:hypothetical protein